jgi:DNA-binding transcriptional ArsR family regulator
VENCKKFPSAISGHLKKLKEAGIIYIHYDQQRRQLYRITDRRAVIDVLEKYPPSINFIDKAVDRYIDFLDKI